MMFLIKYIFVLLDYSFMLKGETALRKKTAIGIILTKILYRDILNLNVSGPAKYNLDMENNNNNKQEISEALRSTAPWLG